MHNFLLRLDKCTLRILHNLNLICVYTGEMHFSLCFGLAFAEKEKMFRRDINCKLLCFGNLWRMEFILSDYTYQFESINGAENGRN